MIDNWEERIAACWESIRSNDPEPSEVVAAIDALAAERAPDDPDAIYERASARDSAGFTAQAEPLYGQALGSARLDPRRRPQAVIQLASTLRIIGRLDESEALLAAELERCARETDPHALPDETRAFLALTYLAQGKSVDAATLALLTLAPHLKRYTRSVSGNAAEIAEFGLARWLMTPP